MGKFKNNNVFFLIEFHSLLLVKQLSCLIVIYIENILDSRCYLISLSGLSYSYRPTRIAR